MQIPDVLRYQAGVVTRAQAVAAGMSERTIRRRVAQGRWWPLYPGVFLAEGHRAGDESMVRGIWLWAGAPALVSGPASAYWHGMLGSCPGDVEITVPARAGHRPPTGIRIRRRDVPTADRATVRGLALTARPLAAIETAVALPDGSAFLDRALQKHVDFAAVYAAYCRNLGARGSARAGLLLTGAADRAASIAERRLVRLLRAAGIDGWVLGLPFGPHEIDVAFPARRLAIEVDGWAWHTDPDRFQRDRVKGNDLVAGGWELLRFTWHHLVEKPAWVVEQIRRTLDRAA